MKNTTVTNIEELSEAATTLSLPVDKLWRSTRILLLALDQVEVAEELGVSKSIISMIENGRRKPSAKLIFKFAALKERLCPNVRFLTPDEVEEFPYFNLGVPNVAILTDKGWYNGDIWYYGQTHIDQNGASPRFITTEDGDYISVKRWKSLFL